MKKFILPFFLILFSFTAHAQPVPDSFADLVDKLQPSVVNISTTQKVKGYEQLPQFQFMFPPGSPFEQFNGLQLPNSQGQKRQVERKATSLGSGFIIDAKGVIVTNNHVVADAEEIIVTLHDDTKYKAKIIGRDSKIDIAVLKIEPTKPLPFVRFGDSDKARVGDWIIAIGNPYGLGGSVSAGIISARARDINVGPFDDFLQTDAAINRGNSGGPMFNMAGEVIGIATAIFSPSGDNIGIGFALPSTLAQPTIKQIQQYGKAKRAWLGVKIQTVTDDIAQSLGLKESKGALVLEVLDNSPALKAGIAEGDVVLKFNGQEISAMKKLPRMVSDSAINAVIPVQIFRNGEVKNLSIRLGEMNEDETEKADSETTNLKTKLNVKTKKLLGMDLVTLTPELRKNFKIANEQGVLIMNVDPASEAAQRGIASGFLIVKANNKKISNVRELEAAIEEIKSSKRGQILLLMVGGNEARFIALPVQ